MRIRFYALADCLICFIFAFLIKNSICDCDILIRKIYVYVEVLVAASLVETPSRKTCVYSRVYFAVRFCSVITTLPLDCP